MFNLDVIVKKLAQIETEELTSARSKQAKSLIDLTLLDEKASDDDIKALCEKAIHHQVAAVCIYPDKLSVAKAILPNHDIAIATVANFPHGQHDFAKTKGEIDCALAGGADELDIVFPYEAFLNDQAIKAIHFISQCQHHIDKRARLKVIIESGVFDDTNQLYQAALALVDLKVDFLKTSTGKVAEGASISDAAIILQAIAEREAQDYVGFKASGGIREAGVALQYMQLAEVYFGDEWVNPKHMRFGASQLLDTL